MQVAINEDHDWIIVNSILKVERSATPDWLISFGIDSFAILAKIAGVKRICQDLTANIVFKLFRGFKVNSSVTDNMQYSHTLLVP